MDYEISEEQSEIVDGILAHSREFWDKAVSRLSSCSTQKQLNAVYSCYIASLSNNLGKLVNLSPPESRKTILDEIIRVINEQD